MEWLTTFFYNISEIFPRLLHVTEDMVGLKMHGPSHTILEPGYHIYWPILHEIRSCYVTRQELDLPEQVLTTEDERIVLISTSIVYRIRNPVLALIETHDYECTVTEVAQRAVKELVTKNVFKESGYHSDEFDSKMMTAIQKDLNEYGLVIDNAFFTSIAKTKPLHISGIPWQMT